MHELVIIEYQEGSFPPYRWYAECTCGFQCRLGTESATQSQFDAHLVSKGVKPHFSAPLTPDQNKTMITSSDTSTTDPAKRKWAPIFGKK